MSAHAPHKQLKTIRARLGITQKTAAARLSVSYPYLLSVETGQRDLSGPLACKIQKVFGVARIRNKNEEPVIRNSKGKLVPFTQEEYSRYISLRPSFRIRDTGSVVTPTPHDYARCTHALLEAAEKHGTLRAVLIDFFSWFAQSLRDDTFEGLKQSFDRLFPGQRKKSEAFYALTDYWGELVEHEGAKWLDRKAQAAAMAALKRKKKREHQ